MSAPYKTFKKKIPVTGKTLTATVTITIAEDDWMEALDTYMPEDRVRLQAKFEAGELFPASILVEAQAEGLTGYASIGGVELKPNNMFNSKPFERSVSRAIKDYRLIDEALEGLCAQLRTEYARLLAKAETYKPFAIKGGSNE